jgi:putative specificity protein s
MGLLRPKRGLIEPRYLCYAYLGPQFQEVIRQHTLSGATVDRIPVGEMPNWPILLPSLETQRAVLSVLNSIDGLIENNRRRIEVLEEMARAIYREWFVKFRFPGHQDVRLVNSELGLTPEGWDLVAASDVLLINPRIKLDKGVSHPFINMGDLSEKGMSCRPSEYRSGGSGSKFVVGDTLFSRITPCLQNGKTGLVQTLGDSEVGRGSTEFIVLRGRLVGSAYTYCLARNEHFRAYAEASMSGASGRQRVRNECFDSYMIAVPPRELAQQFEQASQPMFAQIRILTDETLTLVRLRDRLLPKLVTGQIDVSGLDLEAVDAKEEAG